jgi:ribonuclease P protein component
LVSDPPHGDISPVKPERFPKSIRVKTGTKEKGENLIVFRLQADDDQGQRFGIRIPGGVKNAVGRNRIKRVIREVLRKNRGRLAANEGVVVVCRASALRVDADKLKHDLQSLIQ